ASGRFTLIFCERSNCKETIMNEARRKNMISISGMISIRVCLRRTGEGSFTRDKGGLDLKNCSSNGRLVGGLTPRCCSVRLKSSARLRGVDHHLHIGGGGFQFELQTRDFAAEK